METAESWGRRVQTRWGFDGHRYRAVAERIMATRTGSRLELSPRWSQWRARSSHK